MQETTEEWLTHLEKWRQKPYDGLSGSLPEWVPEPYQQEFIDMTMKLFTQINGNKREYLKLKAHFDYLATGSPKREKSLSLEPKASDNTLLFLVMLFKTVCLGKVEGTAFLTGRNSVKALSFSSGGLSKKGREYEPKLTIRQICERIKTAQFKSVLQVMGRENWLTDMYESTKNPTGVLFTHVDHKNKIIFFRRRKDLPNVEKQISFQRLRDILTEIKKTGA